MAPASSRPAVLFWVSRALLVKENLGELLQGGCEEYFWHLSDKVTQLHWGLDSAWADPLEVIETCLSLAACVEFKTVALEEVDKVLGTVSSATYVLDPTPSGWLGSFWRWVRSKQWLISLCGRRWYCLLWRGWGVRPFLKKPFLDPTVLDIFRSVSNLPFLGKVVESMVSAQL